MKCTVADKSLAMELGGSAVEFGSVDSEPNSDSDSDLLLAEDLAEP